jgi:hydroxymethylpyrimidine/phosphomethylpyrimidine kinase
MGVRAIHSVPSDMLRNQIDAVMEDIGTDAVKIGMLHSSELVHTVASAIDRHALTNVVLDPVMVATSGAVLIGNEAVKQLVSELFHRTALVTPNLDEAALLVGQRLTCEGDMHQAAQQLLAMGAPAVLVKGGHLTGDVVSDVLATADGHVVWMRAPRVSSANTHGTGCTLSSAIAAFLALGYLLPEAVQAAHQFVRNALQAGARVRTGHGSGPLNHAHAPQLMRLKPLSAR